MSTVDVYGVASQSVEELRCHRCNRLLAELVTPPYRLRCRGCKAVNQAGIRSER